MREDLLKSYKQKRDFSTSPEPEGSEVRSQRAGRLHPRFVIQKHASRRLHYDFRLEAECVLKSWAVPKGPSTDPSKKRLAIQTEDHPLDYADFEGFIPQGYGAGAVIVWDTGIYYNLSLREGKIIELPEAIERGHVTIWLKGHKVKGPYTLNRMGESGKPWLLTRLKTPEMKVPAELTQTHPYSVLSGRTLEDVLEEVRAHIHAP